MTLDKLRELLMAAQNRLLRARTTNIVGADTACSQGRRCGPQANSRFNQIRRRRQFSAHREFRSNVAGSVHPSCILQHRSRRAFGAHRFVGDGNASCGLAVWTRSSSNKPTVIELHGVGRLTNAGRRLAAALMYSKGKSFISAALLLRRRSNTEHTDYVVSGRAVWSGGGRSRRCRWRCLGVASDKDGCC